MKRVLRFLLLTTILFVGNVYAAGKTTISISPSSKTYIVGNTFTVTVTLTSTEPIGAYDYTVQYNSSILSLESTSAPTGGARNVGSTSNKDLCLALFDINGIEWVLNKPLHKSEIHKFFKLFNKYKYEISIKEIV